MKGCPIGWAAKGGLKPVGCCTEGWVAPIKPPCTPGWRSDILEVGGGCQFGPPVLLWGAGAVHWCCALPDGPFRLPLNDNESNTCEQTYYQNISAIDHTFHGFTGMITHAEHWENTRNACKLLAEGQWFTSFPSVHPTSQVSYHASKPIGSVV